MQFLKQIKRAGYHQFGEENGEDQNKEFYNTEDRCLDMIYFLHPKTKKYEKLTNETIVEIERGLIKI